MNKYYFFFVISFLFVFSENVVGQVHVISSGETKLGTLVDTATVDSLNRPA